MRKKAILLLHFVVILFLTISCKKEDPEPAAPENPAPENPAPGGDETPQGLTGNPALNRFVLTSNDEEIVKVDPATGKHEVVFTMAEYDDVASLDFLNDVIYAGAGDNSMNAISLGSKKLLWDVPLLRYESSSLADPQVVVKDGVCYAVGIPGVLTAVDIATGKPKWLYPMAPSGDTDGYYSQVGRPTVTADKVIIGTHSTIDDNYLHVINKTTGKNIWKKELPEGVRLSGTLKLVGNTLLVPAGNLYAMDVNTGKVLWTFTMEELSRGASSPSVTGNKVLVQGASDVAKGKLYCIDLNTGQKIWEIEAGNDYAGIYAPLIVGNVVIGVYERGNGITGRGNGRPFVADINTGKIIWQNDEVSVETSPVFANGQVYFHGQNFKGTGSIDNNVGLLCLDAKDGKLLWLNNYFRYNQLVTPIVIANNGIFRPGFHAE